MNDADRIAGTLPVGAKNLRRLIHAHGAGQPDAAVGQENRARGRAFELVRDAADELGDDVLERDQSLDLAAFADDQHLVDALLAHVASAADRRGCCSCTRASGRSSDVSDVWLAIVDETRDDILGVEDADDVVGRVAIHRAAGCRGSWRPA